MRIDNPPTWARGIGHSHRSSRLSPRATAEPSALASQFAIGERNLAWLARRARRVHQRGHRARLNRDRLGQRSGVRGTWPVEDQHRPRPAAGLFAFAQPQIDWNHHRPGEETAVDRGGELHARGHRQAHPIARS